MTRWTSRNIHVNHNVWTTFYKWRWLRLKTKCNFSLMSLMRKIALFCSFRIVFPGTSIASLQGRSCLLFPRKRCRVNKTLLWFSWRYKKEWHVTRHSYRKKRNFALSETNKTRFPARLERENWLVSRMRKGREKTCHSFFESVHFLQSEPPSIEGGFLFP